MYTKANKEHTSAQESFVKRKITSLRFERKTQEVIIEFAYNQEFNQNEMIHLSQWISFLDELKYKKQAFPEAGLKHQILKNLIQILSQIILSASNLMK